QGSEHDITDRKRTEEALRESQARYLQAQKMESIGRLAGGVAHDFNNLLTVINGYSEIIEKDLPENSDLSTAASHIRRAGQRAADLTRQLLAFSRKQIVAPRPLDLNSVVTDCQSLAQRLLGEEIQVVAMLAPSLGLVMADSSQMHQVLVNLLVNARDAMPEGGRVLVETRNAEVPASAVESNPDATPGPAVVLEVTDFGVGMDEETRRNLFEPFFTTKPDGKGTGLGLATVYGIVRQSQGWIQVRSELGRGASFQIYLPRTDSTEPAERKADLPVDFHTARPQASRTVLIVEDQDDLRSFAVRVLESSGYRVLAASDGVAALNLAAACEGPIDAVLTDVVLPGMNGRRFAELLRAERPDVRILYTSGYTDDVIAHRGILDKDVAYLPKPYSPDALRASLRAVLDAVPSS
ncbi:MAG: response regulator, partial [Acidobacteriota bacterium]|nr:response regulator [Acidobacteriota bacterium]